MTKKNALMLVGGAGLGAGMMFMLDPDRGRRRRALVRDKAVAAWNDAGDAVRKTSKDIANRATGVAASARSVFRSEQVGDSVLAARVRSAIGRVVAHPSAIDLSVDRGVVTLAGPVLAGEVSDLIKTASGVRGVQRVENRLDVHQRADVPSLEGAGSVPRRARRPGWRVVAGATGGALAIYGLQREIHRRRAAG